MNAMRWRIYRYTIKEILPYFLLTLLVTTAIIFAQEVGRFSELFIKRNVPPLLVRTLLMAVLTRILIITLPISLLTGMLLGLTRMSSDNEIISLFASGLNRKHLLVPLLILSALVSVLLGYITLVEFPTSATRFREIRGQLTLQGIRTQVTPRVFDTRFVNRVLFIRDIDRETDRWEGIFLVSFETGHPVFISGRQGVLELGDQPESSELHLFDGVAHRLQVDEAGNEIYHLEGFSSYHVRFDPQSREATKFQLEIQRQPESIEEKTVGELLSVSPTDRQYIKARVEAGRRLALPFACLLFAPIGLAISGLRKSTGRSVGFVLGIALATGYYLLLFAGEKLAQSRILPPLSAMWLANVVFALFGVLGLQERRYLERWQQILIGISNQQRHLFVHMKARRPRWAVSERTGLWPWLPLTKLMDQYLVGDFVRYFLLCLISLWSIFLVFTLFELSPDIIEHQISTTDVTRYFLFLTPQIVQTATPPCVLLASLLLGSILTRTNQTAALKASGISAYRISVPVVMSSLILIVMIGVSANWIVPRTNLRQDQLRFYIKKGHFPSPLELSPISQEGNWVHGEKSRVFHFERFNREHNEFQQLWILDMDEASMTIRRRIEAARAIWDQPTFRWLLEDARVWVFERDQLVGSHKFDLMPIQLEETPAYFKKDIKKPEYMSASELARHITELEGSGTEVNELRIALERKLALPIACLVMVLVGLPFGFTLGRKGALYGVGLGILLGVIYWLGSGLFEALGRYRYVSAVLAGWGPGGLFGALGVYFFFRVRT